jgi:hypothetical protein
VKGVRAISKDCHGPPGWWTRISSIVTKQFVGLPGKTGLASVIDMDKVPVPPPPPSLPPPLPPHPKVTANKIMVPNLINLFVILIPSSFFASSRYQIDMGILSHLQKGNSQQEQ